MTDNISLPFDFNLTPDRISDLSQQFTKLARDHALNPLYLKMILYYRNKGLNNLEISKLTGIDENTISRYIKKVKNMEREDLFKAIMFIGLVCIGVGLLA